MTRARLETDWTMPAKPDVPCYPEAFNDNREWQLLWRGKGGSEHGNIPWPFEQNWATGEDFAALGFRVVQA